MFEDATIYLKNNFKILCVNIRSLNSNFTHLCAFLSNFSFKFDLLVLTETWLSSISENLYEIETYSHYSLSRNEGERGGGIRIYFLDHLKVNVCDDLTSICETHESLFVNILIQKNHNVNFNLLLGCFYRPPRKSVRAFNDYLNEVLLRNAKIHKGKTIFVGDFNVDISKVHVSNLFADFYNLMIEGGFELLIDKPTHCSSVTGLPNSLIDHAWCNFEGDCKGIVFDYLVTDHMPIAIGLKAKQENLFIEKYFRDFSLQNFDRFDREWELLFPQLTVETDNVNQETERFCSKLYNIVNKCFPIKFKRISLKRLNMPWINTNVLKLINKKHKLFLMVKRKKLPYYIFNAYAKLLKILISKMKIYYYNSKLKADKNNCRKQWATINNILGRRKKFKMSDIEVPIIGLTNDLAIVTRSFNEYFVSTPLDVQSCLGPPQDIYNNLIQRNESSIFLTPSTPQEVTRTVQNLPNKNGLNDIPVLILKRVLNRVSVIICNIFNLIIEKGVYPDSLKIARVIPIYKADDRKQIKNYRPISVLSTLNKIFEKLLYFRLNDFLRSSKILSPDQYGFAKSKDTQQAALRLIDIILPSFGTNVIRACVFLDFSKAFDTVCHSLLLKKLDWYGIRGRANDLLASYLANRQQYVNIHNFNSDRLQVTVGVPQGSVLGPLLFVLYSDDLTSLLNDGDIVMFADDSTLVCSDECPHSLFLKVQSCMNKIIDWCKYNKLSLNCAKTKLMLFSNRKFDFPILTINGQLIEQVETFKYLGYYLDNKLKHKHHLRKLISKMSSLSYISYKINKLMQPDATVNFYYGMVQSHLNYGILVWGGAIVATEGFHRLSRLQDKIVFNLFSLPNETKHHDLNKIYKRNRILKVKDLYSYTAAVTMYKVIYCDVAPFVFDRLVMLLRNHDYLTRDRNSFKLPFPTVRTIKLNFLYQAINVWNELPNILKTAETVNKFKKTYRNVILDGY